jgi:Putative peptidoglycan binding domain
VRMSNNPVLSIGDKGSDVARLQQILIGQGYDCGVDLDSSVFGPSTDSAAKLFQAGHVGPDGKCLAVDGVVGPATWWALENPSGSAQHQPTGDVPEQDASNPIAAAALASARAELAKGVREFPDGSNRGPEIDVYTGMEGVPIPPLGPAWCAYFASWNFARAPGGSPFGCIGGAQSIVHYCLKNIPGSVVDMAAQHSAIATMSLSPSCLYVPRCGDLGVIANGQIHGHAVQVAASQDGIIWTIEGNSGNAVRMRQRQVGACRWYVNFDAFAKSKNL